MSSKALPSIQISTQEIQDTGPNSAQSSETLAANDIDFIVTYESPESPAVSVYELPKNKSKVSLKALAKSFRKKVTFNDNDTIISYKDCGEEDEQVNEKKRGWKRVLTLMRKKGGRKEGC